MSAVCPLLKTIGGLNSQQGRFDRKKAVYTAELRSQYKQSFKVLQTTENVD